MNWVSELQPVRNIYSFHHSFPRARIFSVQTEFRKLPQEMYLPEIKTYQ